MINGNGLGRKQEKPNRGSVPEFEGAEENYGKLEPGHPVTRSRFKPGGYGMKVGSPISG
jgi:hypothetical protein